MFAYVCLSCACIGSARNASYWWSTRDKRQPWLRAAPSTLACIQQKFADRLICWLQDMRSYASPSSPYIWFIHPISLVRLDTAERMVLIGQIARTTILSNAFHFDILYINMYHSIHTNTRTPNTKPFISQRTHRHIEETFIFHYPTILSHTRIDLRQAQFNFLGINNGNRLHRLCP